MTQYEAREKAGSDGATHSFTYKVMYHGDWSPITESYVVKKGDDWFEVATYSYDLESYNPLLRRTGQVDKCGTTSRNSLFSELREI